MAIENRGPELQAVACTLLALAIVSLSLRAYVRQFIVKSFGIDDWFMVIAAVFFVLFVTCALCGVHYGTGRHYWDLEKADMAQAFKFWWFCYLWYCLSMIASKISIGYFLLRITVRTIHIWIIYVVMVTTVLTGVVFFFVTMFQCSPIPFFWDKDIAGGRCLPMDVIIALTYIYSVFSVICDFTFAILPVFLISGLHMDKRTKTVLIPLFLMACAASCAVAVRFAYIKDFKNPDFLYATVDIAIWSTVEQGLAISAGSLATLRPLWRKVLSKLGWSSSGTSMPQSGMPTSSRRGFSNIGSAKQSRLGRGTFHLSTFTRKDDEADVGAQTVIESHHRTSESDSKAASTWRVGPGGSEEELTERPKEGVWIDRQYEVTVSSEGRKD